MGKFSHLDDAGRARMVDVGPKAVTVRRASASVRVKMSAQTLQAIRENALEKGDALAVARVAGILAAKRVDQLIPLAHPLPIEHADVQFEFEDKALRIRTEVRVEAKTGVEMEALTAAATAALTVYDMAKALDRGMVIADLRLESKSGGRSGEYRRPDGPGTRDEREG